MIRRESPCKVNLLLNILGKRPDGFHELETVMHPVRLSDELTFERCGSGIHLTCSDPALPTDSANLVYRAAQSFLEASKAGDGVRIVLEKRLPLAAGLGGGSANAAITLTALNDLFGTPLAEDRIQALAASLGSDVPFFLQDRPALATGRGERIEPLDPFPALRNTAFFLVHPGFGISTAWAYQSLKDFPSALNGTPGRARQLIAALQDATLDRTASLFYNSLEAPALRKYPILEIYQEFLRENGALATLMSGSGSTTFAIFDSVDRARGVVEPFKARFGESCWIAVVPVS
ncbi:MAG TPA: 4-(cytidine 5'-diphospho)-2-C-methyl-D-erythritol kinase [Verrucomicrobia bacterium]|nr:4-(cytidine 5'-diphospho)-2-C-methyl-D-erythritol kinase [Verrucomicrobiota bacterium]HOB31777.1 4-(cytidine 5'-diphospho)-2-C-methyl-D-erythritol kinase [Verrucomicrobiota bacterium]HOP96756.1 4-(cytidine 5'-diphospho)-2-C-methyl-D-erythritol kinase [Verrucomicrobiota bacterium]HPU56455.1 4-(cytidine 5'-diphospho)-2-C-methyl-D-erythritol kinase [Verrucomicrobiota bacterium]